MPVVCGSKHISVATPVPIKRYIYLLPLALVAAVLIFFVSRKPLYNWDMIAYMGVVEEYTNPDLQHVHKATYTAVREQVPAHVYDGLTANIEDRRKCLMDATAFGNELSFFRTKPLYTFLVFLFHKCGVPLVKATLLPSMIAGLLMLLVVYVWLARYLPPIIAASVSILFGFLPIFRELVRTSTPDALSNMLILLSLYVIATKQPLKWALLCLGLAILARVDNIVFAAVAVNYVYLRKYGSKLLRLGSMGVLLAIGLVGIPVVLGDSATWFTRFAFLFSVTDYVQHVRDMLYIIRTNPTYIIYAAISFFLLVKGNKDTSAVVYIVVTTVLIRLFLFPSLQERFFGAFEFSMLILLVHYLSLRYSRQILPEQPTLEAK
jgi:hypothetical protein